MTRSKNHHYWKNFILPGLIIAGIILGIAFVVWLFVKASGGFKWLEINSEYWGQFGSFIGGTLVAITLFFQIRSFRAQQVENKFFEMVKYYRDNVSELHYATPFAHKEEEIKTGRIVLKLIFDQYVIAKNITNSFLENEVQINTDFKISIKKFKKYYYPKCNHYLSNENTAKIFIINDIAYQIVYWGVPSEILSIEDLKDNLKAYPNKIIECLINVLKRIPVFYSDCYKKESITELMKSSSYNTGLIGNTLATKDKNYIKFFGGHQYHLGHFFRHLYQTVNYIDDQPWWLLSKSKKKEYIKMLRAQMSNYEQALLFINSLSGLGLDWEYNNKEGKKLITEYELIKNLPKNFVPNMNPKDFYPGITFEFENK